MDLLRSEVVVDEGVRLERGEFLDAFIEEFCELGVLLCRGDIFDIIKFGPLDFPFFKSLRIDRTTQTNSLPMLIKAIISLLNHLILLCQSLLIEFHIGDPNRFRMNILKTLFCLR